MILLPLDSLDSSVRVLESVDVYELEMSCVGLCSWWWVVSSVGELCRGSECGVPRLRRVGTKD